MIFHSDNAVMRQSAIYTGFILFVILFAQGCALYKGDNRVHRDQFHVDEFPCFASVIVRPGDTLPSLAKRYLDDPDKGWVITDFNDITAVTAGQEIIIPLEPFAMANLSPQGYQTVPVLSYHNFSETKQNLMMVKKHDFERQMKFLKDNGYTVITLDDLFDFLEYRKPLPRKSVVITIDDGWQGVYDVAYPILKKYNFPATLFIYTDLINGSSKTLGWNQVAELNKNGINIQCHTISHRNLNKIKENESFKDYVKEIEREISKSARVIKKKINKDVKYLAYPYGDTNNLVIAFLKKNGFRGAFTVNRDSNPFFMNHFTLNRRMIYGDFDLRDFKKNLKNYSSKALH